MIKILNLVRFVGWYGCEAASDVALEGLEILSRAPMPDRVALALGRPLEGLRRGLEVAADVLDPGEGYVPLVTPMMNALDRSLNDLWVDEPYAFAFDLIERTREIAEAGPR